MYMCLFKVELDIYLWFRFCSKTQSPEIPENNGHYDMVLSNKLSSGFLWVGLRHSTSIKRITIHY